jgi:hypothetical protein
MEQIGIVCLSIGSVNVTLMKGRDGEFADMAASSRRHSDFCGLQETAWIER